MYLCEFGNTCIRKITTSGIISIFAGIPLTPGFSGDGGPATAALMSGITGIAVDRFDNIFIIDQFNSVIRKISAGVINTIAGTPGVIGYSGDGGPATAATLNSPQSIAVDKTGNVYIGDGFFNSYVRKVDTFASWAVLWPAEKITATGKMALFIKDLVIKKALIIG